MRIAVPVSNDRTAETLSGIEGFQFFEEDVYKRQRSCSRCARSLRSRSAA